jgi:hypothetical protein
MRQHIRLTIATAVATVAVAMGWLTPVLAGLTVTGVD